MKINRENPHVKMVGGVCPNCGGHRIVKYVHFQAFYGCLDCGWKMLDESC